MSAFFQQYPPSSVMALGDTADLLNQAFPFEIVGGVEFVAGKRGNAAGRFSAADYLTRNVGMLSGASSGIIAVWIRPEAVAAAQQMIFASSRDGNDGAIEFYLAGDRVSWECKRQSGEIWASAESAATVAPGAWSLVIGAFWENRLAIAVNDAVEFSDVTFDRLVGGHTLERIGVSNVAGNPFGGQLDELCLWRDPAVTPDDFSAFAAALYNNGDGIFYETPSPAAPALALLPSGRVPKIGYPGIIMGNYFVPLADPDRRLVFLLEPARSGGVVQDVLNPTGGLINHGVTVSGGDMVFNGVDAYIEIPANYLPAGVLTPPGAWSVEMDFVADPADAYVALFGNGSIPTSNGSDPDRFDFIYQPTSGGYFQIGGSSGLGTLPAAGQPISLLFEVWTDAGGTARFACYANRLLTASGNFAPAYHGWIDYRAHVWPIGWELDTPSRYFGGTVSRYAIYRGSRFRGEAMD